MPPRPIANVSRRMYYAGYRAGIRLWCRYLDATMATEGRDGPIPPALLRFRVSESTDWANFLSVGERISLAMAQHLQDAGTPLEGCDSILDFGCGCGRTLRWLIAQYPGKRYYGTDVDAEAIAWLRPHFPEAAFYVNEPAPPLPFADASFDLVYGISVLTHLDEARQLAWLAELRRVLRPSGVVLLTVHGEQALRCLTSEDRSLLRSAGYLFRRSRKLDGILPSWYHTAFHSWSYIERVWGEHFRLRHFAPGGLGYQDVVIAHPQPFPSR